MADLGSIGSQKKSFFSGLSFNSSSGVITGNFRRSKYTRRLPVWLGLNDIELFNVDVTGVIPGQINGPSVVKKSTRVTLFNTSSNFIIDSKITNNDGSYSFDFLDKSSIDYHVLALAPGGYNTQVFSKLKPE